MQYDTFYDNLLEKFNNSIIISHINLIYELLQIEGIWTRGSDVIRKLHTKFNTIGIGNLIKSFEMPF